MGPTFSRLWKFGITHDRKGRLGYLARTLPEDCQGYWRESEPCCRSVEFLLSGMHPAAPSTGGHVDIVSDIKSSAFLISLPTVGERAIHGLRICPCCIRKYDTMSQLVSRTICPDRTIDTLIPMPFPQLVEFTR